MKRMLAAAAAGAFGLGALVPAPAIALSSAPSVDCETPEHTNDPECISLPEECVVYLQSATRTINYHKSRANRAEDLAEARKYWIRRQAAFIDRQAAEIRRLRAELTRLRSTQ